MKKIDKTKENIGVNGLDIHTRKKLFNDFIEAGGEVIEEKSSRGLTDFDRDHQKRFKNNIEDARNKSSKVSTKKSSDRASGIKGQTLQSTLEINEPGKLKLFFQRLYIKLQLFIMRVTDFSGYYFTEKFLTCFDSEYKTSLLSMQMNYIDLFKQNIRVSQKVTEHLDRMHPIYYELIELLSNVYDSTIINELLTHHYNFPDISQETDEIREPLTRIFRKLHPLTAYSEFILSGLDKAIIFKGKLEKRKLQSIAAERKKLKNDIYIIFEKLYPRLFWMMCRYEKRILQSNRDIEETFSILPEDIPGKRKKIALKTFEETITESQETSAKSEENNSNMTDPVKLGLELMFRINKNRVNDTSRGNIFKSVTTKDKIFYANLLFEDFDREFSFILTTNKIKFNTITRTSENIDYKSKFINFNNEIGKCKNRFKDYANTLAAFEKAKKEKPISGSQFIEYSNRLTALEKERNQAASGARMYIKAFLEKLIKEFRIMLEDISGPGAMILNPDDRLTFETEIEGDKVLNNETIHDAINKTYNFISAFIYRIDADGDLAGEPDGVIDGNIFNNISKTASAEEDKKEKPEDEQSLINELDDLV
jgi:hypothetical protein